jgi:bifunctional hydroxylase/dehydrase
MDTDVIIVGAGPTGLMLAGELRLGGARVVVLERLTERTGESRGLGFTARTVEVFDQRGLLPSFDDIETSRIGHFGGLQFDYGVLEGAHFGARSVPQSHTEEVLERWAASLGADLRRGWEFLELERDDDEGVEISARTPDGVERVRGSYLVGCDGGQSAVRKAAGFDFPGIGASREMFLADVSGCDLPPRPLGERVAGGMVMSAPLGDGVDRIIVCERGTPARERTESPSFAEVAAAWERLTGEDIGGGTPTWVSSFSDATRQATEYRRGRVLLAGDAAHIHLPAGGQGLSAGVQDAVNLGWKLAATVRGWAPAGLLDTYFSERHPVGARLLMNTRAQGMLFLSGEEIEPVRELFGELLEFEDVRRHLAGMVSHLDIRYDLGGGDNDDDNDDDDPLLGRRIPHRKLHTAAGETTTVELLHTANGVLLDTGDDPALRAVSSAWSGRVRTVTAAPDETRSGDPLGAGAGVLVRPDGYVAWTSTNEVSLATALRQWFGSPTDDT